MNENCISINSTIKLNTLNFDFCLNTSEIKTVQIYFIVYKTTNLLKNENDEHRFYVGKHEQYDNLDFDEYYGSGTILEQAIEKYGEENFKREILEICQTKEDMNIKETEWILSLSANCLEYPNCGGMNMTNGGSGGDTLSNHPNREEIVKHLSEIRKGEKNPFYGKHHKEESIKKIKEANYKETRKTPTLSGKNHPMWGKKHKEDSKEKMRNSAKGKKRSEETKIKMGNAKRGTKMSEESKRKMRENHKDYSNGNHPNIKYKYVLSNGEDFYLFFNKKERKTIYDKFYRTKLNIIEYKGILITKIKIEEL